MKKVLLIFSITIYACILDAQTILKSEDLLYDLAIARKSYEQMHPGLYKYKSKAVINAAFETTKKSFEKDQTLSQAYLSFHKLTASFQCGHAYPNFYNQTKALKNEVFENSNCLPFHFKIIEGKMIVFRTADEKVKEGLEIVSINGKKVQHIFVTILPIIRADGSNDGKRKNLLENGKERHSYFDIFYPLLFPPKSSDYTLETYDRAINKGFNVIVTSLNHTERDKIIKEKYQQKTFKWKFEWLDSETAVMTINDFANYSKKYNYDSFYVASLDEYQAQKGRNLIVDLRKNEGGNTSEMFKLLPYFTHKPIEYYDIQSTWQMLKIDSTLIPYVDNKSWASQWFSQAESGFTRTSLEQWKSKELSQPLNFKPSEKRFGGSIYLLSSATNSSATYMMVEIFKKHKLATIVGQTTGGNQRGITAGAMFFMLLPKTQIEVDVPLIGMDLTEAMTKPDAGIEPDVFVNTTINSYLNGLDPEIEAVKKLIKSKAK
ncbi:MAG: S41 family peptidase [Leadbetterella sp.]